MKWILLLNFFNSGDLLGIGTSSKRRWSQTRPHVGGLPKAAESNTQKDGYTRAAPVKSFAPNGYGLYDMAGNVWEWCSDWYSNDYYQTFKGKGLRTYPPFCNLYD